MANENQIVLEIVLDDGTVKKGIATISKEMDKLGKDSSKGFADGFLSGFGGLKTAIAGALATIGAGKVLSQSIEEAIKAEDAVNRLNRALANTGQFSPEASASLDAFSKSLESLTGFEQETIQEGQALLLTIGKLKTDALEPATQAALNLAEGLRIGPEQAFTLLSKAAAGNVDALSRYGIKIDESIPKSERFTAALEKINQAFGGAAEGRLNTFSGALTALQISFGNLFEEIGKIITGSPALREIFKVISESVNGLTKNIEDFRSGGDVLKPIIINLLEFAKVINDNIIPVVEIFVRGFLVGLDLIKSSISGIVLVISGLFSGISELAISLGVDSPFINGLKKLSETAGTIAAGTFQESFNSALDTAGQGFNTSVSDGIDAVIAKMQNAVELAKPATQAFVNVFNETEKQISESMRRLNENVSKAVQQGIVSSISQGLSKIGANLAQGKGAFDDFGKTILGILGDLAIQVGTMLVAFGLGIDNIKVALSTFNGALLVAAGAALVVIGGALKALSGGLGSIGGGSTPSVGSAGGGGVATGEGTTIADNTISEEERQRQAPGTTIIANFEGANILGDESAGRRIVELINGAFDTSGVAVRQGITA